MDIMLMRKMNKTNNFRKMAKLSLTKNLKQLNQCRSLMVPRSKQTMNINDSNSRQLKNSWISQMRST